MPKTAYKLNRWSKEFPTKENVGEWLFMKRPADNAIFMVEVRYDDRMKELFLSRECHDGITKTSYGTALSCYTRADYEFCGPIQMPPNYRA